MNDSLSQTATLLEIAKQMKEMGFKTNHQIQLLLFAGSHDSIPGSIYYRESMSQTELSSIGLWLKANALGSPNYGRFLVTNNPEVRSTFESYFNSFKPPLPFIFHQSSRSFNRTLPYMGVTSGTGFVAKSQEWVDYFGGTLGPYFPWYVHQIIHLDSLINRGVTLLHNRVPCPQFPSCL